MSWGRLAFAGMLEAVLSPGHTSGMDVIAQYRLHLKYADGHMVPVWLRIGRPVEIPMGNWECPAEIEGELRVHCSSLGRRSSGMRGANSWQALAFTLRFMYDQIRMEVRDGAVMYSENGKHPIHFDELFPLLRDWQRPAPE